MFALGTGRTYRAATPPPPRPARAALVKTAPGQLLDVLEDLAPLVNYNLDTDDALALVKTAIYGLVLDPDQPHAAAFFDGGAPPPLDQLPSAWSLVSSSTPAQAAEDDEELTVNPSAGKEYSASRRGKPCGRIFKSGEPVYRCRDCQVDGTCVMCATCFHASEHARQKHDVTMTVHAGAGAGCCDCGDSEAFHPGCPSDCAYHAPVEAGADASDRAMEEDESAKVFTRKKVAELLRLLADFMLEVFEGSPEEMTAPRTAQEIAATNRRPLASTSAFLPPATERSAEPPADPFEAGPSAPPPPASAVARGKARARGDNPRLPAMWSVVLWNDEKHSFAQVIDQVSRAADLTRKEANIVAQKVDTVGRDIVFVGGDPAQLVYVAKVISSIQLAVTVRRSIDTWEEQIAALILDVLGDFANCQFGGVDGGLGDVVAEVLLETREDRPMTRAQRMFEVDHRLWKKPRRSMVELLMAMMTVSVPVKHQIGWEFMKAYPAVASAYLMTDREPENSILLFSVQIFTVPSVSTFLVTQGKFLSKLLNLLFAFFTEQVVPNSNPRGTLKILNPSPQTANRRRVNPESAPFKERKYVRIFDDLSHLLAWDGVKDFVASSTGLLVDCLNFLDLFTNMNPHTRASQHHVEYESDTWVTAFNVTIQLSKLCKSYGEGYRRASPEQLAIALNELLGFLSSDVTRGSVRFHELPFGGTLYKLVQFRPERESVSFHHPLGWLFAEICKNTSALGRMKITANEVEGPKMLVRRTEGLERFLTAMDQPLRVAVLVAQIRSGLWVRNGFGMRAQQLHYREYSLRESTFDQDAFFLQTALVVLEPSQVVMAILDRFALREWLGGQDHPVYDPTQAFSMVEEMLHLFIMLLSDPTYAAALAPEQCLEREAIHILCLGSAPYSDIVKRLTEELSDSPLLEKVLARVARYKPPGGSADQGSYSLRDEYFSQVNPYFSRYTRNQREEADGIIRQRRNKLDPSISVDAVIVPQGLGITQGPFDQLSKAFGSEVLLQIIFCAMKHGRSRGDMFSEAVVDEALHLCMLAQVEQPAAFAQFAAERVLTRTEGEQTLLHLLVRVSEDERLAAVKHKAAWCLDQLELLLGAAVASIRAPIAAQQSTEQPTDQGAEAKRQAAKARQAAIMAKFAQAQQSFLDSSENVDEADEDLEDDTMMEEAPSFGTCIVCQEDLTSESPFGTLVLLQPSNILRQSVADNSMAKMIDHTILEDVLATPLSLDRDASAVRPLGLAAVKQKSEGSSANEDGLSQAFPQQSTSGIRASSCGHMMHTQCFDTYQQSVEQRHATQTSRHHPEDLTRHEFICPLCKSLGNILLPVQTHASPTLLAPAARPDLSALPLNDALVATPAHPAEEALYGLDSWAFWHMSVKSVQHLPARLRAAHQRLTTSESQAIRTFVKVAFPLMRETLGEQESHHWPQSIFLYTLQSIEVAGRGQSEEGFAESVPDGTLTMLKSLMEMMRLFPRVEYAHGYGLAKATRESLELLGFGTTPGGVFKSGQVDARGVLEADLMTVLLQVAAGAPQAFLHAAAFAFYGFLLQTADALYEHLPPNTPGVDAPDMEEPASLSPAEKAELESLAGVLIFTSSVTSGYIKSFSNHVALGKLLYSYTLPFLRRVSLLYRVIGGSLPSTDLYDDTRTEMTRLLEGLNIPPPAILFNQDPSTAQPDTVDAKELRDFFSASLELLRENPLGSFYRVTRGGAPTIRKFNLEHPAIYELLGLPHHLDRLIAESQRRKCRSCKQVPAEPAFCLLCGQILCYQSFCCMDSDEEALHGECNTHMWTCGGAIGVFFIVRKNTILYLYTNRGSYALPPYLDSHGEVDTMSRSRKSQFPQFLHRERYDEIRKTWLNHGIPTYVVRKLDATHDSGGWETL